MDYGSLDEIQWKSPEFIQQNGLYTDNVLTYFSLSPFYDKTSNNQVLLMQLQYLPPQIPADMSFNDFFFSKLKEMIGIEFVVIESTMSNFWVIRKRKRMNPLKVIDCQDYYIVGSNVYQAPKVYDILSSRILNTVLHIKNSIKFLNQINSNIDSLNFCSENKNEDYYQLTELRKEKNHVKSDTFLLKKKGLKIPDDSLEKLLDTCNQNFKYKNVEK